MLKVKMRSITLLTDAEARNIVGAGETDPPTMTGDGPFTSLNCGPDLPETQVCPSTTGCGTFVCDTNGQRCSNPCMP